ncbi:hypothetical protein SCA_1480 [Staphylococcus carnosus subsp. carnosus TM300]|uniref:Uncharacterized protein n=1 Tax=Staphylococcus carnosus (strain TM300) TaxID=396513 RepID=B9DMS0_STACT|nr:hypothetical protein SCA_1480 [Staphylococcus carnosus subsp. carnosus TM300]
MKQTNNFDIPKPIPLFLVRMGFICTLVFENKDVENE